MQRPVRPAGVKQPHHFSAARRRQLGSGQLTRRPIVGRLINPRRSAVNFNPPVTLIWRLTLGRLCRRSMMKSWPFGFSPMARSIAAESRSLSAEARSGLRKSEASSWPRQVCSVPVQVMRTRLQDFAEVVGHRRDEAELAAGLGDADVAGRAAGVVVEVGQRELLGEPRAQQRQRHILVDAAFADVAHRHHLDQRQRHALAVRPLHQRGDFVLVQVLQRHRVDLDAQGPRRAPPRCRPAPCRDRPSG